MMYLSRYSSMDIKKTLLISLGFHILVLFLFLLIKVGWEIQIPEFMEISFVRGEVGPGGQLFQPRLEEQARAEGTETELIKLPKRRMVKEEEPQFLARDAGKLTPEEKPSFLREKQDVFLRERREKVEVSRTSVTEKEVAPPADLGLSEKELPKTGKELGAIPAQPFKIEGEAAQRSIISKVVPEYPKGLHKEAIVRIQFTVLPNGLIGEMIPILKGDAALEKLTLDAFRQWRFNPLPQDVPQEPQKGVVTFRYLLK
jgi:TonB family protein